MIQWLSNWENKGNIPASFGFIIERPFSLRCTFSLTWTQMLNKLKTVKKIVTIYNGLSSTALSCNWPSMPIYHIQTRNSKFMADWSKPPHSPVFQYLHVQAFHKVFHLSIQIFILFWSVCFAAHGSNKNRNHSSVYQKTFHCINNDVTVAIINIVHTLWSAEHNALVFLDWWDCVEEFTD